MMKGMHQLKDLRNSEASASLDVTLKPSCEVGVGVGVGVERGGGRVVEGCVSSWRSIDRSGVSVVGGRSGVCRDGIERGMA